MFSPFLVETLSPLLLAAGLPLVAFAWLGTGSPIARALASATCILCGCRYVWWRWGWSMPGDQEVWQQAWAWIFLVFETLTVVSSMSVYFFMSRTRNRSPEVDARAGSTLLSAPVDVFIATYNEGREILERTLVGATSIDHPDLRVWVLDDGARPWVREMADSMGALYCCRVKGKHAKAGNVNNGLHEALGFGRRPQFLLLLDADFVAARRILQRTLPLFEEADVGIVQTPQHFFNLDPIQANLLCGSVWPDEQRFFFNHLQPAKDAWGAAFCCGTSAVFRVDALVACGGMPTATVTEDMLTSFRMREEGYRTVFLNEQLSLGLAPEGLGEYITQRSRWCLGAVQQFRTRWSFAGRAKMGVMNRLSALDGLLFWVASFVFKLMMISAPMIYWWTGTAVLDSTVDEMLVWLAPYLVSGMVFSGVLARNTVFPIMTDMTHLLAAPMIVRTVAIGLLKPWGHPFKVTAKGVSAEHVVVQWSSLAPFAVLGVGTILGMVLNISPHSPLNGTPGYTINVFWSVFNVAVLAIACAVCVELPKRRRDERFAVSEATTIMLPGAPSFRALVVDMSLGGARITRDGGWGAAGPRAGGSGEMVLDGHVPRLRFAMVRVDASGMLSVRFLHSTPSRLALTRKLFTGGFDNEVDRVRVAGSLTAAVRRVFG